MLIILKKIKKSFIYSLFLKIFFINLYSFFWHYILNFSTKTISKIFLLKKRKTNFIDLENNSKKLVLNNQIFTNMAKRIFNEISEEKVISLKKKISSEDYKKEIYNQTNNEAILKNVFSINIFNDLSNDLKKQIVEFSTSDLMIKTAAKYLGVYPILRGIYLNVNYPVSNQQSSSQLWHRDDFGYKNLDFFLAVTDIDENNGPLITLKKKDPYKVFYRIGKQLDTNVRGERGKIKDSDFDYLFDNDKDSTIQLKGKSGTALFIDSIRNYHKGGFCKKNHRIVLRINYMTHDSVYNLESNIVEKKEWFNLLEEKKRSSYFIKKLITKRSNLFKYLKVPEFLFKFYHVMSIKK